MRLISKDKLIQIIINDLRDFRKIESKLYTNELNLIINYRIEKVYNLNYTMDKETQLFLFDLIIKYSYNEMGINSFKRELRILIKWMTKKVLKLKLSFMQSEKK